MNWDGKTIPFGKHKGLRLDLIPSDYLLWVVNKDAGDYYIGFGQAVRDEIKRREAVEREFEAEEEHEVYKQYGQPPNEPPYRDRRSGRPGPTTDRTGSSWASWGDTNWADADAGRGPSNSRTHSCAYCTDGILHYPASYRGMHAKFCQQCALGRALGQADAVRREMQAKVDRAMSEARDWQRRCTEAQRRASQGSYSRDYPDSGPRAAYVRGGSVSRKVAKSIIDKVRITFAAKYHTPEAQKDPANVKIMADINACCDWFLKCVEQLTND